MKPEDAGIMEAILLGDKGNMDKLKKDLFKFYITKDDKKYIAIASNPESKTELYSAIVKMLNLAQ